MRESYRDYRSQVVKKSKKRHIQVNLLNCWKENVSNILLNIYIRNFVFLLPTRCRFVISTKYPLLQKWSLVAIEEQVNIDGIISSGAGFCYGLQKRGILIVGDLASWHDLGSFLQLQQNKDLDLLVVILNNHGGGIFEYLPVSNQNVFQVTLPHSINIAFNQFSKRWEFHANSLSTGQNIPNKYKNVSKKEVFVASKLLQMHITIWSQKRERRFL